MPIGGRLSYDWHDGRIAAGRRAGAGLGLGLQSWATLFRARLFSPKMISRRYWLDMLLSPIHAQLTKIPTRQPPRHRTQIYARLIEALAICCSLSVA